MHYILFSIEHRKPTKCLNWDTLLFHEKHLLNLNFYTASQHFRNRVMNLLLYLWRKSYCVPWRNRWGAVCRKESTHRSICVRNVFLMFTCSHFIQTSGVECCGFGGFFFVVFFSNGSQTLNSYLNFIKIKWYWWTNRSVLFKLVLSCWTSLLTALQFKLIFWVLRHLLVLETFKWTLTHGAFVQHSHNLTPFRATIIHWITGSVVWKEGMRLKKMYTKYTPEHIHTL